jgi:tetratricopeptide (TPR) repeat protein
LLQNTPFHPIAEWGRQRFGGDLPAEQRLADLENTLGLIGLDAIENAPLLAPLVDIPLPPDRVPTLAPEELRRRQLAALVAWVLAGARSQPVTLAFEDLQWADPSSLDLMRALAERGAQAPLFIVATARPEFRPSWSLRSHHSVISLAPLDRVQVRKMVGELASLHALSKEIIEGVGDRTGGVPLFIEEVTRLLLERGEQGGVQAIPPTLQQSLAARLDRLGEAREVAQIGAVLGRDFAYPLLGAIAELDESALQVSLERLADADILFVEGVAPQSNYRFKHALIQDAAYESLLKSRRHALHRRAADELSGRPLSAAAEPEAIAHHFTEAGLDDLAIEWWRRAGDKALRRSAFQEAISHLGKAIAMADTATGGASGGTKPVTRERLQLQTDYSQAVMWSKGYASNETKAALERAHSLSSAGSGNPAERCISLYSQWVGKVTVGEMESARLLAESMRREADDAGLTMEARAARRILGFSCTLMGDFREAHDLLTNVLRAYDPACDGESRFRFTMDTRIGAMIYLAVSTWHFGDAAKAQELVREATSDALATGHAGTLANGCGFAAMLDLIRGDARAARTAALISSEVSQEHGMRYYVAAADMMISWAHGQLEDRASGASKLRTALTSYVEQGNKVLVPTIQGMLAEFDSQRPLAKEALAEIDAAITLNAQTGERWTDSLLHRIRGEVLLKRDPSNATRAEEAFKTAVAIARQQGSRSFELQAALSLAKLYQSSGRRADGHAALAPALEGFAPTPEFPEIAEATALLSRFA